MRLLSNFVFCFCVCVGVGLSVVNMKVIFLCVRVWVSLSLKCYVLFDVFSVISMCRGVSVFFD